MNCGSQGNCRIRRTAILALGVGLAIGSGGAAYCANADASAQRPPKQAAVVRVIVNVTFGGEKAKSSWMLVDVAIDDMFKEAGFKKVGPEAKEFAATLRVNIVGKPLSHKVDGETIYSGAEIQGEIAVDGEVPRMERFEARQTPDSREGEEYWYVTSPEPWVFLRLLAESDMVGALARVVSCVSKQDELLLLARVLFDESLSVRKGAAVALARLGEPGMRVLTMVADLETGSAWTAAWGLSRMGEPGFQQLVKLAKKEDVQLRSTGIRGLGGTGKPEAVPLVIPSMKDKDEGVRIAATVALGDLGGSQSVQALAAVLQDGSPKVRQSAVCALERIGRPAIKELTDALSHKDSYVRQCAAGALVRYKDPAAVPALIAASKDSELEVRRYSLWALAKTGDSRAADAFVAAFGEADEELQWRAEEALICVGPPAVPALLAALKHEKENVRRLAIKVLGKIGDEQALPALRQIVAERHDSLEGLEAEVAISRIVSHEKPKAQ